MIIKHLKYKNIKISEIIIEYDIYSELLFLSNYELDETLTSSHFQILLIDHISFPPLSLIK